jgi:hypothetical protein
MRQSKRTRASLLEEKENAPGFFFVLKRISDELCPPFSPQKIKEDLLVVLLPSAHHL